MSGDKDHKPSPPKRLGVTGSRNGWTVAQEKQFQKLSRGYTHLHHGDCVGVDACAAEAFRGTLVSHPPTVDSLRAFVASNETRRPAPYLKRNKKIVDEVDLLLAFPDGPEKRRSGTWSTVRYAREHHVPLVIVYPSGEVRDEREVINLETFRKARAKLKAYKKASLRRSTKHRIWA